MIAHLVNGPGFATAITVSRAPLFLRVWLDDKLRVHALDRIDAQPPARTLLHVYRRRKDQGQEVFYRYVEPQPEQDELRDEKRWQAWATAASSPGALT